MTTASISINCTALRGLPSIMQPRRVGMIGLTSWSSLLLGDLFLNPWTGLNFLLESTLCLCGQVSFVPVFQSGQVSFVPQSTHTHTHTSSLLSLSHTHKLSLSLSLTHTQVLSSLSLSHTHRQALSSLSLSLSHTHTHTSSLSLSLSQFHSPLPQAPAPSALCARLEATTGWG